MLFPDFKDAPRTLHFGYEPEIHTIGMAPNRTVNRPLKDVLQMHKGGALLLVREIVELIFECRRRTTRSFNLISWRQQHMDYIG